MEERIIAVTGSEGYLAKMLISKLKADPRVKKIYGIDIREESDQTDSKFTYIRQSVTDPLITFTLKDKRIDTLVHAAWWFNPTHDRKKQEELDILGTINVVEAAAINEIRHFVYLGSTTAYAPLPENPAQAPFLKEVNWQKHKHKRLNQPYLYGRHKARIDQMMQTLCRSPERNIFWVRGSIVLGPNTNNVVSYIAKSPFTFGRYMFRIAGYDPPMQFVSEYDFTEVIYRACMEKWSGVANLAGRDVVKYSELIRILGRKEICLPAWMLYPVTEILWRLRLFKFPSSLLTLIQHPWVADIGKLENTYGYKIRDTSKEALCQFVRNMK